LLKVPYADFEHSVTNARRHSSLPRPDHAISFLADGLARLQMVLELIVRSPYGLQSRFWKAWNLLLRFGECQLDGLVIVCRERHHLRFRFN